MISLFIFEINARVVRCTRERISSEEERNEKAERSNAQSNEKNTELQERTGWNNEIGAMKK